MDVGTERTRAPRAAVVYGLAPILALGATVAIEAGERQSLAQAVDGIQAEFGVSDFAIGALPAMMAVVGVLAAIPIGILADRMRRARLLGAAMVAWTGAMILSAMAPGYGTLVASRLSVGAVEGNSPAAVSLIADYYPMRKRAQMFGLYQGGALVGSLLGLVAGGLLVDSYGWRWAFWVWVPVGVGVAVWVWRLREPERGAQDLDIDADTGGATSAGDASATVGAGLDLDPESGPVLGSPSVPAAELVPLPAPVRVGTLDYRTASVREVLGELARIRSMWLAVAALTLSQFLLAGLQFWGVEFFKRAHDLSAGSAGLFTGLFGLGAAVGVVGGGFVSDRYLRRGVRDARIYVVAASSIAAPVALVPAFLIPDLALTVPFFIVGGMLLTTPIAPGEAIMNDVVVAPLRGRAGSVRGVLRSLGALSPVLVGALSDAIGLRAALAVVAPVYAVGGVLILSARRSYGADLAYVAAETRRLHQNAPDGPDAPPDPASDSSTAPDTEHD